jgi:hypothetical protein
VFSGFQEGALVGFRRKKADMMKEMPNRHTPAFTKDLEERKSILNYSISEYKTLYRQEEK